MVVIIFDKEYGVKVSLESKNSITNRGNVSFGYRFTKDDRGFRQFETSFPYDTNKYDGYLEIYKLDTPDKFNNFKIDDIAYTRDGLSRLYMDQGKIKLDLARTYGFTPDAPFAYHVILEEKNNRNNRKVEIDAGLCVDERSDKNNPQDTRLYNIVPSGQSERSRGGAMKLVNVDAQHVGTVYNEKGEYIQNAEIENRGYTGVKSLTNRYGGTLAGLEKGLDNGDYAPFSEILTLPITAQKDVYWTENLYQIDSSIGNINNYASLQRKLFAKRKNLIFDGAFVNEGLTGIHFNHMLKWGVDSPYFRWFKARSLYDKPLSLGVFPKNTKNVSYKLVNIPFVISQNSNGQIVTKSNKDYDSKKPSYIQYFDTRLVTDDEKNDKKNLIHNYSKINTENLYDLTTHNDSVVPYSFEINPADIVKNIKFINEYNKQNPQNPIKTDSYMAARMLSKFPNFSVDEKFESGFETWDANPDIAKLNFVTSKSDLKALKSVAPDEQQEEEALMVRANAQVRDYTIGSGRFWTKLTNDVQRLYAAQNIANIKNLTADNAQNVYKDLIDNANDKVFPSSLKEELNEREVKNVLSGRYFVNRKFSDGDKKSQILEGLMNTPIDSVEFGNNLAGVLSSPLISKRASVFEDIDKSRYELFKAGDINLPYEYKETYQKMNDLYSNEMLSFAQKVLDEVDSKMPADSKLFDGEEVTQYGRYVLPIIMPQLAKYTFIKALAPNLKVSINKDNGEISYDYKNLKQISLQTIGVKNPGSPEDEALMVLSKLKDGLKYISESSAFSNDIVESISKELKGTSANSFALADLIINKTQSGLDYRIDATKDIADIEALRNGMENLDDTWQTVTDFWKSFSHAVLEENPHSYLVAEITNLGELQGKGHGDLAQKFKSKADLKQKFFRETGILAEANYEDYFYNIAKLFAKSFEDGNPSSYDNPQAVSDRIYEILIGSGEPLLKAVSLPSMMYTYSFINNHDKPRALHCAALDMGMFYADLNNTDSSIIKDFRKTAYTLIKDKFFENVSDEEVANYNFEAVSPKAVAMGLAIRKASIDVLKKYHEKDHKMSKAEFDAAIKAMSKSVADLSDGKFMDKHFEPDSFGVKPIDANIDKVIEQAKRKYGLKLPRDLEKVYADDVFEQVLKPAVPKLMAMMKYLVALPGMPTLFDGDDYCATGYDSETKNMHLATRQKVHEEWATKGNSRYKKFIDDYKKEFDKIMSVRNNPKCNALNNGKPYLLPPQNAKRDFEQDYNMDVPAILRQSADGRMAISLLNPASKHAHTQRFAFDHEVEYEPEKLTLDSIKLNFTTKKEGNNYQNIIMDGSLGKGVKGLTKGMIFRNAYDDNDIYKVDQVNGLYFLKRESGDKKIHLEDTTLNLYYVPEKTPLTFTGSYNIKRDVEYVTSMYSPKTNDCGKKLSLLAK